jgi:hypothetical protein
LASYRIFTRCRSCPRQGTRLGLDICCRYGSSSMTAITSPSLTSLPTSGSYSTTVPATKGTTGIIALASTGWKASLPVQYPEPGAFPVAPTSGRNVRGGFPPDVRLTRYRAAPSKNSTRNRGIRKTIWRVYPC